MPTLVSVGIGDTMSRRNQRSEPRSDETDMNLDALPEYVIQKALEAKMLHKIVEPLVEAVKSSVAIYERDGKYAYELMTGHWCEQMNIVSRKNCGTPDDQEAIASGRWWCHESCWTDCSKQIGRAHV